MDGTTFFTIIVAVTVSFVYLLDFLEKIFVGKPELFALCVSVYCLTVLIAKKSDSKS